MDRTRLIAVGLATLAVLCWSGNWVLGRAVRAELPPLGLNFWRWSVAALILAPMALPRLGADWPVIRAHWKVIAGLALTGAAMFQSMIYIGLRSTEAINALLLNATAPLFVILIAAVVLGERVTARQATGLAVSFLGAAWLVIRGEPANLARLTLNAGDGWVVAALFVWGTYSVMLKFRPPGLSAIGLTFAISVAGAAMMLPLHLGDGAAVPWTAPALGSIVYTGVFASVVAFLAFNGAVARMGPSRTVTFLHLMPVFGSALAIVFLGERLELYHLVGFPVVLGGVLWATTGRG